MSKIRIYELAKELGVENKVILAKAQELGIPGKSSHSHSLDSDEADNVRRAILRQTMGAPKVENSETVTTRVDRTTGATYTVVEKRSGDVIRRRRAVDAPEPVKPTPAPEPVLAKAQAEELFDNSEGGAAREVFEVGEAAAEVEAAPEVEPSVVEPPAASPEGEVVPAPVAATQESEVKAPAEERAAVGPRILGKIELPQRRAVVKPTEVKRPVKGVPGKEAARPAVFEDEEEGGKKGAFKKGRKREISSSDLLDYDGRVGRRKPKNHKHGDDSDQLAEADKPKIKRVVELGDSITVGDLAKQMSLKAGEVIAKLLSLGVLATINHAIDKDTAQIVCDELGYEVKHTEFNEQDLIQDVAADEGAVLLPRPPVVTVMGHVDHGKTSLLDRIRSASVAAKEAGGITQHIGAYSVKHSDGRLITFIDTPGHAAFTAMRARGAQVTDIVILVVAADDGVMPQTREAINHAQAAKVPIIVAINKMDRPDANPDKIKTQLAEFGLQPEDWGGDTMFFPISALKGTGIEDLLEGVLVLAEVEELQANPDRRAKGTIIESRQDRGRGVVATVLVQAGTLRVGDIFVSGHEYGRVRTMTDYKGEKLESAGPSTPVEITGLTGMPASGDDFLVMESESDAREVATQRGDRRDQQQRALAAGPISLEEFAKRASNQAAAELNVILKADVQGSVEAVKHSIEKLSGPKVKVKVLHSAVGGINESDVQLAIASRAIIVGFGVRGEPRAMADAEDLGVQVRFYRVIYELLDDVKNAMVGLLEPIREESNLGRVEVRDTFTIPKIGTIAGCYVTGGLVRRNANARLLRDSRVIHEGKMSSLRRFKDDVREVQAGFECGIGLEGFNDVN
ncbi:MAG: translation initiation factor IF-2, partial [Pseudomonadota bacterium]